MPEFSEIIMLALEDEFFEVGDHSYLRFIFRIDDSVVISKFKMNDVRGIKRQFFKPLL